MSKQPKKPSKAATKKQNQKALQDNALAKLNAAFERATH